MTRLLLHLLSSTGLCASECCALTLQDINLQAKYLTVQRGKGDKRRCVGLSATCVGLLEAHIQSLKCQEPQAPVFLNVRGEPMNRDGLLKRINELGKRIGIDVSPMRSDVFLLT